MPRARSADIARHKRASAPAAGPTMWARVAARIAAFAEAAGAPRRELLAASSLSEGDLKDPDGRVPLEAVYELVERATRATGDDCFGLHFALGVTVKDLDALGFLVAASATLGEALDRIVRYQRLWNDGELREGLCYRCNKARRPCSCMWCSPPCSRSGRSGTGPRSGNTYWR
jgi:hypothetical protein